MPKMFKVPYYTEEQIEELDEKDMIFPFSSKYMTYDPIKRQYIPTEALLLKHNIDIHEFLQSTGEDNPANVQEELEFISDQIYTLITEESGSGSQTLKWIVAKGYRRGMTPFRFRLAFEEILWKQARFYTSNDDPTKSIGMDIEQKQWLNKGVLYVENRQVDKKVKIKLMDLGLLWAGSYDAQLCGFVAREDW